jgi:hypothetical protein
VRAAVLLILLAACGDNIRGNLVITSDPAWEPALRELVDNTQDPGLTFGDAGAEAYRIDVVDDATIPSEGYQLERSGDDLRVHAHDLLGAQYGAAAALEAYGFRFRHPADPYIPRAPALGDVDTAVHQPAVRVRGFQFHTLHPIEPYFAFWEPGDQNLVDAKRIIDWVVKNRGNYIQWCGLDNIDDPAAHDTWQPYTAQLIDYAHSRGVRVGLNAELFSVGNLQQAYDLANPMLATPIPEQVAAKLPEVLQGNSWDVLAISFGEFFDEDPDTFISTVNAVAAALRTQAPGIEMHAIVHVGATQNVTYMGRDLLYYFLVQYADPTIVPDIHTVMFYNMFQGAHGAYQHQNFDEHKQYLEERMGANEKVGYFPEDAYWVAFDDSVPQYYPLYATSRWTDLHDVTAEAGPLDAQYLFSSGWEWGYWLHDVVALRSSYELGASADALIAEQYAPDLAAAAPIVSQLAQLQTDDVMIGELAPYLGGRDSAIDGGRAAGIISQPDRITFDDMKADATKVATIQNTVLPAMSAYADALDGIASTLAAAKLDDSRWSREIADGLDVDRLRARFVLAAYGAAATKLSGGDPSTDYAQAGALYADAQALMKTHDADLHDLHGTRLVSKVQNSTFYQFGYLYMADTLCYWRRELLQVGQLVGDPAAGIEPNCVFP